MTVFKRPKWESPLWGNPIWRNVIFGEESGVIPPVIWILTTGYWNDTANWVDTETWNDWPTSLVFTTPETTQYIPLI